MVAARARNAALTAIRLPIRLNAGRRHRERLGRASASSGLAASVIPAIVSPKKVVPATGAIRDGAVSRSLEVPPTGPLVVGWFCAHATPQGLTGLACGVSSPMAGEKEVGAAVQVTAVNHEVDLCHGRKGNLSRNGTNDEAWIKNL